LIVAPGEPPSAYPGRLAASLGVIAAFTVAIFAVCLELAAKLKPPYLPHLALLISALAIALVWPHFALMTSCVMVECF
jgi:hypothetical protein